MVYLVNLGVDAVPGEKIYPGSLPFKLFKRIIKYYSNLSNDDTFFTFLKSKIAT